MALVLEDGTGLATAESYASVSEADAYWTNHGSPAAWTAATADAKEDALRTATDWIDARYGERWQGSRVQPLTQRLTFPRYGVVVDGTVLASSPLPRRLKEATIELAKRHIDAVAAGSSLTPDVEDGALAAHSVTLGAITESKTYVGGKPTMKQFPQVTRLLAPLTAGLYGVERA